MKIVNKHNVAFSSSLFGIFVDTKHLEVYAGFRADEVIVRCDDLTCGKLNIYYVKLEQSEIDMMKESSECHETIKQRLIDAVMFEESNEDEEDSKAKFVNGTFIKSITKIKDGEETEVKGCCE